MKFQHRLAIAALSVVALGVSSLAHAAPVSGQGTWETTLQGRDLDGNLSTFEAYYDTVLNITWLANANYGAGSSYDTGNGEFDGDTYDGAMTWPNAIAWASSLNPYGSGITGWRLPTTVDADGPDADALGNDGCDQTPSLYQGLDCGYNITAHSEMSHMFYVTLGDKAFYDTSGNRPQPGWGLTNTGPFSNLLSIYWSATEDASYTDDAWSFYFSNGAQGGRYKYYDYAFAWAVHGGDVGAAVATVPVPAAAWLFGSGLLGLVGMARRKVA